MDELSVRRLAHEVEAASVGRTDAALDYLQREVIRTTRTARKSRPVGRCQLCGKPVWGSAYVPFDNGVRHARCIPGGASGQRYHDASSDDERTK